MLDKKICDAAAEDVGVLVPVVSGEDPVEKFYVDLVELAIKNGFDIVADVWAADVPVFLSGEATDEMLFDLQVIADFSLQFLEDEVPDGFVIEFQEGVGVVLESTVC